MADTLRLNQTPIAIIHIALFIDDEALAAVLENVINRLGVTCKRILGTEPSPRGDHQAVTDQMVGLVTGSVENYFDVRADSMTRLGWEVAPVLLTSDSLQVGPVLGANRGCVECWRERELTRPFSGRTSSVVLHSRYGLSIRLAAELVASLVILLLNNLAPPPASPLIRFDFPECESTYSYVASLPKCARCNSAFVAECSGHLEDTIQTFLRGD